MKKVFFVAVLATMLIMPSLASAYDFVVNGRITDSSTGNGIPGVGVNGNNHGAPPSGFTITYLDPTGVIPGSSILNKNASTGTSSTGYYTISINFPDTDAAGRPVYYIDYRLDLLKNGYQETSVGKSVPAPNTASDGSATMTPN